jgi:hypothetical protein
MEASLLVLALAFGKYCEPLPPDLRVAVEAAMDKRTPDELWLFDREAAKNYVLQLSANWAQAQPSMRDQMRQMHEQQCERAKAQLKADFGQ